MDRTDQEPIGVEYWSIVVCIAIAKKEERKWALVMFLRVTVKQSNGKRPNIYNVAGGIEMKNHRFP